MSDIEYRKVQGLVGEQSFSVVLPKSYAIHLGIGKGDFVKVRYYSFNLTFYSDSDY
jgi:hypothetical protein